MPHSVLFIQGSPRAHGIYFRVPRWNIYRLKLYYICRTVQQRAFYREYQALIKNEIVNASSDILSLSPFLDESGLMRVGGRLKNSNLAFNVCHLILLPRKYILTQRIIEREHGAHTRVCKPRWLSCANTAIFAIHRTWNNTKMCNLF